MFSCVHSIYPTVMARVSCLPRDVFDKQRPMTWILSRLYFEKSTRYRNVTRRIEKCIKRTTSPPRTGLLAKESHVASDCKESEVASDKASESESHSTT